MHSTSSYLVGSVFVNLIEITWALSHHVFDLCHRCRNLLTSASMPLCAKCCDQAIVIHSLSIWYQHIWWLGEHLSLQIHDSPDIRGCFKPLEVCHMLGEYRNGGLCVPVHPFIKAYQPCEQEECHSSWNVKCCRLLVCHRSFGYRKASTIFSWFFWSV